MNRQLLLENIRGVLMRLEDTILFALIERAQFRQNPTIYEPGKWPQATGDESLMGYLLLETEKSHARLRRYTSPDEHPFFEELPEPVLPRLRFDENPLRENSVNLNPDIRRTYEKEIIPFLCQPGDDAQYGSSAVCDVSCLQALSKRIHYGKFVAESKYRSQPEIYQEPTKHRNRQELMRLITDADAEQRVLQRVERKARTYGSDLDESSDCQKKKNQKIAPEKIAEVYADWIIPLTKEVEILYLLER